MVVKVSGIAPVFITQRLKTVGGKTKRFTIRFDGKLVHASAGLLNYLQVLVLGIGTCMFSV